MSGGRRPGVLTVGQDLDDLLHLLLEPDFQDSIRLVDDERLQVLEDERSRVLPIRRKRPRKNQHTSIDQSRRRRDDDPALTLR